MFSFPEQQPHTHTHTHTHACMHTHTHLPCTQTELDKQDSYWSLWWTSEFWKKTSQPRVDVSSGNDSIHQLHTLQQTTLFWLKTGHWQPTSLQGFPQGHCKLLYIDSRFPTGPLQIVCIDSKFPTGPLQIVCIDSRFPTGPLQIALHWLKVFHMATADCSTLTQGFPHGTWPLQTTEQPTWPQGFKHGHYRLLSNLRPLKDSNMTITDCWAAYITSRIQTWPLHTALHHFMVSHMASADCRATYITSMFSHMFKCPCGTGSQTLEHIQHHPQSTWKIKLNCQWTAVKTDVSTCQKVNYPKLLNHC